MVSLGNARMNHDLEDADTPPAVRYFAYGSNMQFKQMQERCSSAAFLGIARFPGYKLAFTRYSNRWEGGVADMIKSKGTEVYGVIYTLSEKDLDSLDQCEGYNGNRAASLNSYNRREIEIVTTDRIESSVKAWTYFATKQADFLPPSARYLQQIIEGAISSGFPEIYIAHLRTIPSR